MRHILLIFIAIFWASPGLAQAPPPNVPATCDPDFMDVMEAQAWMEGKREMEAAQRIILKPDSVLQYSCFDTELSGANQTITGMINAMGGNYTASGDAILEMAEGPLLEYIIGNFPYSYAGNTFSGNVPGGGNTCSVMDAVWDFLKCQNFDDENFMNLRDLAGNDLRAFPVACNEPSRSNKWLTAFVAANPIAGGSGGVDPTSTYLGLIYPDDCDDVEPIPTGVIIKGTFGGQREDAVCPAPGCYSDGDSCN